MTSRKGNSSKGSTQETHTSSQATATGSSHRPRSPIGRFLKKLKEGAKKLKSRSRDSRSLSPAPLSDEHALSTPNTEAAPSVAEGEADTESALRGAQEDVKHIHPLSGPATTAASVTKGAQEDLHDASSFQETYLKPLKIFDDVIGKIADVWGFLSIGTELIQFHSYIHMQRWRWACYLGQPKYAFS
ncbi:hypothetical protein C8R48DRAFT_672314 [Suillus tomentosus]|nr:hypothetical protein C8R48DRAFT_672314 [Suillus tomentosus]